MKKITCTEEQFNEKYERYSNMIFKICILNLKNIADAEDVTQEVFLKLMCQANTEFVDADHEKCWIIRVTINLCKDRYKSFWNKNKNNIDDYQELCSDNLLEVDYHDLEILQKIMELPIKYKDVIHLYYYEGYSVKEISKILNCGESTIKMRMKRGRELLKMEMEEELWNNEIINKQWTV